MSDLTVVIPVFNGIAVIDRAVNSVRAQFACPVIVIDDGSTDGTAEAAVRMGCQVFRQSNQGAAAARQAGLAHVRSNYVIFLDADDELMPGMVDAHAALTSEPGVSAIGGSCIVSRGPNRSPAVTSLRRRVWSTESLVKSPHSPFPPSATVWRTRAVRRASELQVASLQMRFAEDFESLIRVSRVGGIVQIPVVTCRYSLAGGKSVTSALEDVHASERIRQFYADQYCIAYRPLTDIQVAAQAAWRVFLAKVSASGIFQAIASSSLKELRLITVYGSRTVWLRCRTAVSALSER